jgi:hypothetical protein
VDGIHLAQSPVASSCEHGDEPSDCVKGGEFLNEGGNEKLVPHL